MKNIESTIDSFYFLRKTGWLIVLLAMAIGLLVFEIEKYNWLYSSETRFYVNESLVLEMTSANLDPTERAIMSNMATSRVLLLINSDELLDSVVMRFNLIEHYDLQEESTVLHASRELLASRIYVERDAMNSALVILKVRDSDRQLAADMANYIVVQLNALNKALIRKDITQKIDKYKRDLTSLHNEESTQKESIQLFVDSLLPRVANLDEQVRDPVTLQLKSYHLFGKLDEFSSKYTQVLNDYYYTLNSLDSRSWESISVLKKATPARHSGFRSYAQEAIVAFIISLAILSILFTQAYMYRHFILFTLGLRKEVPQALIDPS